MKIGPKIKSLRQLRGMTQADLAAKIQATEGRISNWERGENNPDKEILEVLAKALGVKISDLYGDEQDEKLTSVKNSPTWSHSGGVKIPLYDAIAVAGLTTLAADQTPIYEPAEFIDAGTWFRTATAAMRIAGDSMFPKYRPGCVIALREVFDLDDIDFGKDYVIETTENRWLKCLMESEKGDEYVKLRSYAVTTDQQGKLVHAPRNLHKNKIKRIYRVLGQVLHESGGEDILQRPTDPKMTITLKEK